MREIKFRAWHTGHKTMFSAEEMAADQLTLLTTGKFINVHSVNTKLSQIIQEMIPLQFTGLKDKNGTEIYEGDIIEWKSLNTWHKDSVKYNDGHFYGVTNGFVEEVQENMGLGLIVSLGCEVIGNIYENKDLLEVK